MKNSLEIAFILCAGMGTRMGPLGRELPKVMWPVFEEVMLGLQIKYARSLGIKKIYLNTHHCSSAIEQYLESNNLIDVEIIHEEELLDVGGAIHNLLYKKKITEKVLILNGDQFLFSKQMDEVIESAVRSVAVATLLEIKVNKGEKYNRLLIKDNYLQEIISSTDSGVEKFPTTYSGVSIVDFGKIKYVQGKSSFFKSVANFKVEKVECILMEDYEYWDFGTFERYLECHKEIISQVMNKKSKSIFIDYIILNKALYPVKIKQLESYNSTSKNNYRFSSGFEIVDDKIIYQGKKYNQI